MRGYANDPSLLAANPSLDAKRDGRKSGRKILCRRDFFLLNFQVSPTFDGFASRRNNMLEIYEDKIYRNVSKDK